MPTSSSRGVPVWTVHSDCFLFSSSAEFYVVKHKIVEMPDTPSLAEQLLAIIADETRINRDELDDDMTFSELGVDGVLAKSILSRLDGELASLALDAGVFQRTQDVMGFRCHISALHSQSQARRIVNKAKPVQKSLALLIQRSSKPTQDTKVFLLPDGSGTAMAYAGLGRLGPDICLYALNSPFLQHFGPFPCPLEGLAPAWVDAIRKIQPHGPYTIGGWSAGGFYTTEVVRLLLRAGEQVDRVILIDSPCRLEFGALPVEVVRCLAERNLMGTWGQDGKIPPRWLLDHFAASLDAVDKYRPEPVGHVGAVPEVWLLSATDGVFGGDDVTFDEEERLAREAGLDLGIRVNRFLLLRRREFGPFGWERLFPGARIRWAKTGGNHFTMVHAPHGEMLGRLIGEAAVGEAGASDSWTVWKQ